MQYIDLTHTFELPMPVYPGEAEPIFTELTSIQANGYVDVEVTSGLHVGTHIDAPEVVANYRQLWHIERAFRVSKTDLRVRPIYHSIRRRIEAHLCIAFTAYAIWKEVEQLLADAKIAMTAKRAAELTHTMYQLHYRLPDSKEERTQILAMDDEQQSLYDAVRSK